MIKFNLIVAYDSLYGIGKDGKLPWDFNANSTTRDDILNFKRLTTNQIVVMGNGTWKSMGKKPLPNRINVIFTTKSKVTEDSVDCHFVSSVSEFNTLLKTFPKQMQVFIIGGSAIFTLFIPICQKAYVTQFNGVFDTDTLFPQNLFELYFDRDSCPDQNVTAEFGQYTVWESKSMNNWESNVNKWESGESGYLLHLNNILQNGHLRQDRTTTGTISIFGCNPIRFDISNSVPLLTTKKMGYRGIIKELLWFLRGDTDAKILEQQNVNIWNKNTSRDYLDKLGLNNYKPGILGPGYGWSWRHYNANYDQELADSSKVKDKQFGFDQIGYIEHLLKTDPFSRRIFLTSWNPSVLDKVALPPCHVSAQFYVSKTACGMELSCHVYMRSNDTFLGCPYNIFSYTVLVYILAIKCNMTPKELIISFGDAHIYTNHLVQINTQLNRKIFNPPQLKVSVDVATKDYSEITINDFEIINYQCHPSLGAVMSA
ncbi:hypothetical protein HDU81_006446 [Chytriomyces hyalinus]|nr:hypothetical protein HDU81_006446 [Chytriomyces hyalinus]